MSRSRSCVLFYLLSLSSALSVPYFSPFGADSLPQTLFTTQRQHKPADLPHSDPTDSFWTHSPGANPLAAEGSTGALTDNADVCIIGSGITGVSAAYHLANAVEGGAFPLGRDNEVRAVILEAREFCSGATGRNGGNLTPVSFAGFRKVETLFGRVSALRHYAIEHYSASEMVRIAREAAWAGAVDLVEGGHIDVMLTQEQLAEFTADFAAAVHAGKNVNDVSWLSREAMNVGVRTQGYNLWPLKFVTQLFNQTRNSVASSGKVDLRLHTRTPVTSISPLDSNSSNNTSSSPAHRWSLATPRGSGRCTSVLHATNGYVSHLLPHMSGLGPDAIIPVRGQVLAMRAAAPLEAIGTASGAGNEGYWFPRPVSVGGDVADEGIGTILRGFLPQTFPGRYEPGREPEAEWWATTHLEIPFVGPVLDRSVVLDSHKGQFIAAGYAGHGMPRAYGCAEVAVQMIAAELGGWEWEAPEWFPRPFLTWSVLCTLVSFRLRRSSAWDAQPSTHLNTLAAWSQARWTSAPHNNKIDLAFDLWTPVATLLATFECFQFQNRPGSWDG
ncbi:FAD dependent oxidoreductase [Mycena sanguinolenta]|uniref:FAD dependent oxidoreductase n=1 Tax=Mycena sanguinolenta TaxID=230812 RepID=A0A8H6Z427_9AGAR|nr:FAD dependent oxidoreductase [Mycena sanguinolenta]